MMCRAVCVSGPDGAQMRDVARGVAETLGFALVDEEIIQQAAVGAGLEPELMADVERRRSFMERAIQGFAAGADPSAFAYAGGGFAPSERSVGGELRELIRTAIEETAGRGNVVIVAHAASHALASQPDVLRVLVTASPSTRHARVASERGLSEKDAAHAVDQSDSGRADYLRRFYGAKSELPTHYDVVVNTDRLGPSEAVALVALAVESLGKPAPTARRKVRGQGF
jgi:cytidylate kinase